MDVDAVVETLLSADLSAAAVAAAEAAALGLSFSPPQRQPQPLPHPPGLLPDPDFHHESPFARLPVFCDLCCALVTEVLMRRGPGCGWEILKLALTIQASQSRMTCRHHSLCLAVWAD